MQSEAIAKFRAENRAMPLSTEARIVVGSMTCAAILLCCVALTASRGGIAFGAFAFLPLSMAGFVLAAEKLVGIRPGRTLVLGRFVSI